jgi:hypothetical protein
VGVVFVVVVVVETGPVLVLPLPLVSSVSSSTCGPQASKVARAIVGDRRRQSVTSGGVGDMRSAYRVLGRDPVVNAFDTTSEPRGVAGATSRGPRLIAWAQLQRTRPSPKAQSSAASSIVSALCLARYGLSLGHAPCRVLGCPPVA